MSFLDRIALPSGIDSHEKALRLLERQKAILQARERLLPFCRFTWPDAEDPDDATRSGYDAQPFHERIAEALEDFERGDTRNLIFCMPPRHGKSEMATRRLTAWYSGRHPEHDVIVAAYSDEMARDFGADVRAILASSSFKQVFPDYKLRKGGNAKDNIQTARGGRLVFVGRGGAATGRGAHLLLLDDIFKDYAEASSAVIRDQAWHWFTKVAMTRRMGMKLVCLTMTRWHDDDVIGRITDSNNPHYSEKFAKQWKIIRLPAIADDDDPLGRTKGDVLWPDRYDIDYLEMQRTMDPLGFEALFQQRPTLEDGMLYKRKNLRFYDGHPPENLRYFGASDHAVGVKQRNDLTCLLKGGIDQYGDVYLTECVWDRMPTDVVVERMIDMHRGPTKPNLWWAEKGHISMSIGPFMHKRFAEENVWPNIVEMTPVKDKMARGQSGAGLSARGKIYFPKGAWWTEKGIAELLAAPNGTRDDFYDTLSWFGIGIQYMYGADAPRPQEKAPEFGTLAWVKEMDTYARQKEARANRGGF